MFAYRSESDMATSVGEEDINRNKPQRMLLDSVLIKKSSGIYQYKVDLSLVYSSSRKPSWQNRLCI